MTRVWSVRHEIEEFLGEIGGDAAEGFLEILQSENSMRDMAFLTDILGHLNGLNLKLQGEEKNVTELWQTVTSFSNKLQCLSEDIVHDMNHFPTLKEFLSTHDADVDLEAARSFITDISNEMSRRFAAFEGISHIIELVSSPFQVQQQWKTQADSFPDVQIGPVEFELCDLRADVIARTQFAELNLVGF